ncbi:RNA 2',3'-cyclic phosphodiesterase [Candidatus Nanosalina sp. VS9-1]|uniref:RNA 2',3'-cyclic phosphodiesterase n=1 Tax=Candidatus Nanosalina sp. VS9-1 TaxID=3388566 RepID=UPI0039DFF8F2
MARVFSAVDIEDEDVLDQLEKTQERLNLGFNTVPREKMHITLEFFEDVNEKQIDKIKRSIRNIQIDSFQASINGVGAFPSEDYMRVVWAGLKAPEIFRLKKQVSTHGVTSQDQNSFTPHITLLRVQDINPKRKRKLQKHIDEYREHSIADFEVNKVKLFESVLTENGSKYRILEEKKL